MGTKLEPLLNRVVLKRIVEKAKGLLDIAPSGQTSADRAVVLAVGPGMFNVDKQEFIPCFLKPNDVVLINPLYGMKAMLNGENVLVQREDEILCKETQTSDAVANA